MTVDVAPLPPRGIRVALRLLQAGAVAVVLAVSTFFVFELDRFFVPKELVLHLTAVFAGVCALRPLRHATFTRIDWLLLSFFALSAVSALFATNPWLSLRALAITASSLIVFWTARAVREAGLAHALLRVLAFAVVLVAALALLQAYGIESTFFSENRAPGGTLGNRNFVAHAAAFGLPLVLLAALRGGWFAPFGVTIVTASLVLTRSRAAWLAFAAVLAVFLLAMILSGSLRREGRTWRRLGLIVVIAAAGVVAALLIPNTLRWRSDNPYLETAKRVADYSGGSGRGRLVQYEQSLRMAAHDPLLGTGPGNWAVVYPAHAARNDPSMSDSEAGATSNPWPSSDWIAFIAERGFAAAAILFLAFAIIAMGALRQLLRATEPEEGLRLTALLGTLAGAGVSGTFDAVLLIGLPSLLVWMALGALWNPPAPSRRLPVAAIVVLLLMSALGAIRSAAQLTTMQIYTMRGDRGALERASKIDPGNYRLHLRLARMGPRTPGCAHARAAHALYPNAKAAMALSERCR